MSRGGNSRRSRCNRFFYLFVAYGSHAAVFAFNRKDMQGIRQQHRCTVKRTSRRQCAIRCNFQDQAVIVRFLTYTGRFDIVVYFHDRGIQCIHRDETGRALHFSKVLSRAISLTAGNFNFHIQFTTGFQSGQH